MGWLTYSINSNCGKRIPQYVTPSFRVRCADGLDKVRMPFIHENDGKSTPVTAGWSVGKLDVLY